MKQTDPLEGPPVSKSRKFAVALDLTNVDDRFRERFWSKVDIAGPDECWEWKAYRKPSGYGQFVLRKGVFITASRAALALSLGRLDEGLVARHTCDNPPCCNPAHLLPGTGSDNALDSVERGRANRAQGEATASAKLTEGDVRAIRATPYRYGMYARLARQYGVSDHTVRAVYAGRKWRHVEMEAAS